MNYAAIRDQVHAKLLEVTSIGTHVYKRPRYSADWKAFADLNTSINPYDTSKFFYQWTWIDRVRTIPTLFRDEANVLVAFEPNDTWAITYFRGFSDDDTHPSQDDFHLDCDAVMEKFDWLENLGLADDNVVFISDPLQMTYAGLVTLGGVLLHRGDFSLRIVQRDTTP